MSQVGVDETANPEPDPLGRRWDLFPVAVDGPGVRERMARVAVDGPAGTMRVYVVPRGSREVQVLAEGEVSAMTTDQRGRVSTLTDAAGDTWTCTRASGCGCGHPLRKFNPWE